tara:strand:- start:48 stop:569 length:522 start_codon:yes stop_codon:yes gene_type:complete
MEKQDDANFIHTWTGGKFYFLNPRPEDVNIEDIAHALSLQCRFNGHVTDLYSVAEHSIRVADIVSEHTDDPQVIMTALLHDASEAYLGDIVKPLKNFLPDYVKFEHLVEECIAKKFSIIFPFPEVVGMADKQALEEEFNSIHPFVNPSTHPVYDAHEVEHRFLSYYNNLRELM